jgi:hypothetical protein
MVAKKDNTVKWRAALLVDHEREVSESPSPLDLLFHTQEGHSEELIAESVGITAEKVHAVLLEINETAIRIDAGSPTSTIIRSIDVTRHPVLALFAALVLDQRAEDFHSSVIPSYEEFVIELLKGKAPTEMAENLSISIKSIYAKKGALKKAILAHINQERPLLLSAAPLSYASA